MLSGNRSLLMQNSELFDWKNSWAAYERDATRLEADFRGRYTERRFDYLQPLHLQKEVPARLRKAYQVAVAYTEWGARDADLLICVGGVANCAHRFHHLAAQLGNEFRVVCLDLIGRGRSGWLADQSEYCLATYVEQLRQAVSHFGAQQVSILGSSLGGTVAIVFAAQYPDLVSRLILNDTGPYIPAGRRRRRAETLARHYVFRTPAELLRKVGASQKNDGPVSEAARQYITHHQTRWSDADMGRIYRCDPRALLAYRAEAHRNVNVWPEWQRLSQPVLVLHGEESDALLPPTLRRMRRRAGVQVIDIPHTGHTPALDNPEHADMIRSWLHVAGDTVANRIATTVRSSAELCGKRADPVSRG